MEKPRKGQFKAIKFALDAFEAGKKFVVLEAPTGAGKSAVAMTVAKFFKSTYYLTIQKMLQDQLCADFGEQGSAESLMVDLKGRNAYPCTYQLDPSMHSEKAIQKWKLSGPHNCADGHCIKKGKSFYPHCTNNGLCPYLVQVEKAVASKMCLMNFSSFLFQTTFTQRFAGRELMILDEGHNIESQLMNFITLSISDYGLGGLRLPKYHSPEEYAEWFIDHNIIELLESCLVEAKQSEDTRRADELTRQIKRLKHFLSEMSSDTARPWVAEFSKMRNEYNSRVTLKPVFIDEYAHKHIFEWADHILIMSATILDVNVMARSLKINKSQVAAMRLGCNFPVEKRPIYFKPAAKVTGGKKNMPAWAPALTAAVTKICEDRESQRGIIHTHNFYIAEMLINSCSTDVKKRLLYQKEFDNDKSEMLAYHTKTPNTILIAPAMHEGIDLAGDLSRFQIVCKVPFPNQFDDKQLAARMEIDPQFYTWLTALKLVQSVGRSVRSETDWADTFILDRSFEWWHKRNLKMLPAWFKEALVL